MLLASQTNLTWEEVGGLSLRWVLTKIIAQHMYDVAS